MATASRFLSLLSTVAAFAAACGPVPNGALPEASDGPDPVGDVDVSFARDVMPVLTANCIACHDTLFLGDYRTAETAWPALTGPARALPFGFGCSDSPPEGLVVPGDPNKSALWQLVGIGFDRDTGECPGDVGMPKNSPAGILRDFDPDGAELIRRWIEDGARND